MTTAYNIRNKLFRSASAGRNQVADPGVGGDIIVSPTGDAVVVIETTGARSLQDATSVPLGSRIVAMSTIAGAEVQSVTLNAGTFAEFIVILNSSGVHVWSQSNLAQ